MINHKKSLFLLWCLWLLSPNIILHAQTDDDIEGFLKAGKACYRRGMLKEAALEFENVLIMALHLHVSSTGYKILD